MLQLVKLNIGYVDMQDKYAIRASVLMCESGGVRPFARECVRACVRVCVRACNDTYTYMAPKS